MRIHGSLTIGNKHYKKGDFIPWHKAYPFFMLHMLVFGGSGFLMAYGERRPDTLFLYMHGGFAILIYTIFYFTMFGRDEVKWMFINALLGLAGIYTQIGWILSLFDKDISDFPIHIHVIPFLYFVLYTFLLRQAVIDLTHARDDEKKTRRANWGYIAFSLLAYTASYFFTKQP